MLVGLGIDVAELARIRRALERFGERFARRVCTEREMELWPKADPVAFLAAQFAGKEAAVKALGTGFSGGVTLHCAEILREPSGRPTLHLNGRALEVAESLGVRWLHVSLTHGRDVAAAVAVLEK